MGSEILTEVRNQNPATCSGSWTNIADFSATGETVQGTNSVVLFFFSMQLDPAADNCAEFRFYVNGSPVGPICTAFSDSSSNQEANSITMVYAMDGLSGSSNSWSVQWNIVQGSPVHDTSRYRTFQVVEISEGDAEIIVDMEASNQTGDPSSWTDLFTSSSVAVAGTGSVLVMIANVPYNMEADESSEFRFAVDSTAEVNGPEACTFTDESNGGNSLSMVHVLDGLSQANHTFHLEWQAITGAGQTRAVNRTFQVVELTANATLKLNLYATDQQSAPGSFANVPDLSGSFNVAGTSAIELIFANIQNAPDSSDSTCNFNIGVDGTNVGADLISFSDSAVIHQRMCMAWAETGLSAASHSFQARWQSIAGGPVSSPSHTRTLYAIELAVVVTYKLEGITKDNDGSVLVSCECYLVKDNLDNTYTFIDHVTSDGVTGAYSFTGLTDNDAQYQVISWKDDSPNVFDVSDHILQPVVE